jgi:hypothetical protein
MDKGLLKGLVFAGGSETLNGLYPPALQLKHGDQAGADGGAVHKYRARAALPLTATLFGTRQSKI